MKTGLRIITVGLVFSLTVWQTVCGADSWETGLKTGYDSNVNRAIGQEKSDTYLLGALSYARIPTGESRLDWLLNASLEGAAYNKYRDLSYGLITVSPGLGYFLHRLVTVTVSPFFEAKAVTDSDQSALATGGKVLFREQLCPRFYLGQYYVFKASSASADTYSYTENAVGVFAGAKLTDNLTGEVGYEYSYGNSFRSLTSIASPMGRVGRGRGGNQKFSQTFDELIVREAVDRNAIGINVNIDWTRSIFSTASYLYTSMTGDSGTSNSHTGYIGVGYRF